MLRYIALSLATLVAAQVQATTATDGPAAFAEKIVEAKASMMADPGTALIRAGEAQAFAARMQQSREATIDTATALWLQGEAISRLRRPVEALPLLQQALALSIKATPRGKLTGDILLSRGWVEATLGHVQVSLGDFQRAHDIFRANADVRGQAKALQNIGGIYHDAGDNERSLTYYAQVAELSRNDPAIALAAANNLGETLKSLGRYPESEAQYRRALSLAPRAGGAALKAGILTNLASAQLLAGKVALADQTARRALAIGQLAGAWDERPFIYGVLAQIALKRGDLVQARALIRQTFENVDLANTPVAYRDFHEAAATIYRQLGDSQTAFVHLSAYKRIDDSVRALAVSTNAALMAARFDFTNQKVKISQLETDRLRRERTFEQVRTRFRTILFSLALAAATIVAGLLLTGFLSLRRSRNEVRDANDQLSEANVSLEKALKAKSDFLATTSHEIRTPLNGILGMTQVMLANRTMPQDVRGQIEIVHGAGETMKALVDDILDIAKIETGRLTVETGPFDLSVLLKDTRAFWQARADTKGLMLTLDLADCPGGIESDQARLRQVIFNLMSNAIKFTSTGEVRLSAVPLTIDGQEQLRIAITDTGIGVAEEERDMIFEKFYQVDGGTTRQFAGTGLGLAICRDIAAALGGLIEVSTNLGQGSTFTIVLPLVRATLESSAAACGLLPATCLAEATLLIVESNPLTQRILAKSLRGAVASIEVATDWSAASGRVSQEHIDVVVLQVVDADTLDELAEAALPATVQVVALFDPAGAFSEADLLGRGISLALAKPITSSAILQALPALFPGSALKAA